MVEGAVMVVEGVVTEEKVGTPREVTVGRSRYALHVDSFLRIFMKPKGHDSFCVSFTVVFVL